jgi:hypothetical protein
VVGVPEHLDHVVAGLAQQAFEGEFQRVSARAPEAGTDDFERHSSTPVLWCPTDFVGIPLAMGTTGVAGKVGVARAVVDGFARRDHEQLLSLFAPSAEFQTRVDVVGAPNFAGHDGVRAWLDAVDDKYDRFEIVDAEYRAGADDAVVVSCHLRMQFAGERYGMVRRLYWVFRVDARGHVYSFTSFRDLDDALAAAGVDA